MKKRTDWGIFYFFTIAAILLGTVWGSKAVTAFSEQSPPERSHCIVIDPGHGGEDGGAISCTGIAESTYNLEVALRLEDMFHLLGLQTKLTRATDKSIYTKGETLAQKKISDLKERVRIVNETENPLLISIHQNNFTDKRYSGAQVFYTDTPGSKELAKQVQTALTESLSPENCRSSQKISGIYLMDHIQCTGLLIECGFLSNPEEETKLRDPQYQKMLCAVIASSVSCFLSNT